MGGAAQDVVWSIEAMVGSRTPEQEARWIMGWLRVKEGNQEGNAQWEGWEGWEKWAR